MQLVLEFTEADFDRPLSEPKKMAETVRAKDVAERLDRNYGTVKTHLHRAEKLGLLVCVPRWGRLLPAGQ